MVALGGLGGLRNDDYFELLSAGLTDTSFFGWVRRGAASGLGEARTPKARKLLMERISSGKEVYPLPLKTRVMCINHTLPKEYELPLFR